jgi:3-methyladenine DNA glycosylase/8-oxoguanine DNA glycosylase
VERRTVRSKHPVDLGLTLGLLQHGGRRDPCVRVGHDEVWRATDTVDGPATLHLRSVDLHTVDARAWGPGAACAIDGVPALLGADDDPPSLAGVHPLVSELEHRLPGLRVGRTGAVMEALVPTVLTQRVIGAEAMRAHGAMVRSADRRAPRGGAGAPVLLLPPEPKWLVATPSWTYHRWGVERKRARTIQIAASYAHRFRAAATERLADVRRRLSALPGVGPWTLNEVAMAALGDPDAVSVGDYWLKHIVSYALTGEPRGSDERMLELLEPWRGQRGRVCRLLRAGGPALPRFGPRLSLRDLAAH